MIAVLFEAWPAPGEQSRYLDLAAALRPKLDMVQGFISVERFESLAEPGKLLSLSFWRDEAAVARWRNAIAHRSIQAAGRTGVFSDYRLRIAEVVRDYGLTDRAQAPRDSQAVHDTRSRPLAGADRHAPRAGLTVSRASAADAG